MPRILLFARDGTSPNDVKAVERLLKARQLGYPRVYLEKRASHVGNVAVLQRRIPATALDILL